MKAIVSTRYGSADVLQLQDVPTPTPKANEILIKNHVAVVGPADIAFRKGEPFIVKLMYGLRQPKYPIGGVEFAGEVAAVGQDVTRFEVGDAIFGISPNTFGAYAEYLCVPADAPLAHKADTMSYPEAVGIMDGLLTAIIFLRDKAKLQRGQRILINGASGSVGSYAVQLAKHYGAEVTGVCSATNIDLVKSLGADHVIDYTKEDFTQGAQIYDVIFDAIGKSSFGRCKGVLAPQGIYMTTVPSLGIVAAMLGSSLRGGKKAIFTAAGLQQNEANLNLLTELYQAGKVTATIDRTYPLAEVAEAQRYVETERKKGNVVIQIDG